MLDLRTQTDSASRFSRFELIHWWDQRRLAESKALVIGAGALGNEIIKNLSLVGVGHILVADMDRIENSNLSRSILYRELDNGRLKAEVACEVARSIYPDIQAAPFLGNIVHDLGLGVYLWADVIIGGLDNREARVAANAGAAFSRKPWIDGAIEVLDGVVRVFDPPGGACYECTMNETDWKILENRRSCALLTRDEMVAGRVPTTPTTSSIVAGFQVQEAVKLLHGLNGLRSEGLRVSGLLGEVERLQYPRKPDCWGHESYDELEWTAMTTAGTTVGDVLRLARGRLGEDAVVGLSRDIVSGLECAECGWYGERFASLGKISERDAACPECSAMCFPHTLSTLGLDGELDERTLEEIGVPAFDVLTARNAETTVSYVFDGDAPRVVGALGAG